MSTRHLVAASSAWLVLLLPRLAWACPVCGQGREGSESALLIMSGILSALPLLMIGGIVAWIVSRARAADDDAPPPPPPGGVTLAPEVRAPEAPDRAAMNLPTSRLGLEHGK